jgi:hypothetical protein
MSRWTLLLLAACSNVSPAHPDAPFLPADAAPDTSHAVDAPDSTNDVVAYPGGTYTNAFDGLPTVAMSSTMLEETITGKGPFAFTALTSVPVTGMTGWQLANPTGSSMDTEFRVQDGSLAGSMGRGIVSFGADGSAERALGVLATSNQIGVFGVRIKNTGTATLTSITVAFTGEQWRRGDVATPDKLTFEYGVADGIDATTLTADTDLDFTSPVTGTTGTNAAVDGNANHTPVSKTITGLSWAPNATLVLRWTAGTGTGKDDGLAIDDFSFSAH